MPSTLSLPRRRPAEERHPPPAWKPASERSHTLGLFHEASDDDYERAKAFCTAHRPTPPKLLPSNVIDRIRLQGCAAWGLERPSNARFIGHIERGYQAKSYRSGGGIWKVRTEKRCRDTCIMSDLPLMAGLYDIHGRRGVYYEVRVNRMEGVVAIGTFLVSYSARNDRLDNFSGRQSRLVFFAMKSSNLSFRYNSCSQTDPVRFHDRRRPD
jgi:Ran-binding protein 9/10